MKISYSQFQTFIFCLFLISGEIKFVLTYYNFPIDITLFFAILIVLDIVRNVFVIGLPQFKLSPNKLLLLVVFLSFYLLFFASLLYTPSTVYAYKKTFYFSLCLIAFVYPIFIRNFNIDFFARTIAVAFIPAAIWFIITKYLYWKQSPLVDVSFDPLLGSYLGLSSGVAFLILYFVDKGNTKATCALILLLLALGSRGTFIFIILIVLIWKRKSIAETLAATKISSRISYLKLFVALSGIAGIFIFWNIIAKGFEYGLLRFASLMHFSQDNSSNERIEYLNFAVQHIQESFFSVIFGHGIGSFGLLFTGQEARDIPHNIFLEAWFELGILGVIALLIITIMPLLLNNRLILIKIMAIYFLLDSLKSGGFDEMRFAFGIWGALIFITTTTEKTTFENVTHSKSFQPL